MAMRTRFFYTCCVVLALLTALAGSTGGDRVGREGEVWLRMSFEMRNTYAVAYVLGFGAGFDRGCDEGARNVHASLPGLENDPVHLCLQHELQFPNTDSLAKSITDFYKLYPADRYLYITDVMNALGRGMKLEEIHKHASPIGVTSSPQN